MRVFVRTLALTLCLLAGLSSVQGAAETNPTEVSDKLSAERLAVEITQLEKAGTQDKNKTDRLRFLRAAFANLQEADEARKLAASFKQAIDVAPKETARLKKDLSEAVEAAAKQGPPRIPKRAALQQF